MMNKTWWGTKFVEALQGFIDSGRLSRGKAYRTDRRILSINFHQNTVSATVRGNANPYFGITKEPRYKITLDFKIISLKHWTSIIKNICENPSWLSRLMLNELPDDIEEAFNKKSFLPQSFDDINAKCSCPDYANPCKHIAGVYFRIAQTLDNNPMLLFPLRGIDSSDLHKELRRSDLGQIFSEHLSSPNDINIEYSSNLYPRIATITNTKNITASQFWDGNLNVDKPEKSAVVDNQSEIIAALIKKQGDYPPFWYRNNSFINAMEQIYLNINMKNKL